MFISSEKSTSANLYAGDETRRFLPRFELPPISARPPSPEASSQSPIILMAQPCIQFLLRSMCSFFSLRPRRRIESSTAARQPPAQVRRERVLPHSHSAKAAAAAGRLPPSLPRASVIYMLYEAKHVAMQNFERPPWSKASLASASERGLLMAKCANNKSRLRLILTSNCSGEIRVIDCYLEVEILCRRARSSEGINI